MSMTKLTKTSNHHSRRSKKDSQLQGGDCVNGDTTVTRCTVNNMGTSSTVNNMGTSSTETTESQFTQIFREIFQVLERAKKIPDVKTRVNRKENESRLKGRSKGQRKVAGRQVEEIENVKLGDDDYPVLIDNDDAQSQVCNHLEQSSSYAAILRKGIK